MIDDCKPAEKQPDRPFSWKHEFLRALISVAVTAAATTTGNAVYRFLKLGVSVDSLSVPLLLFSTGVFIALSFALRLKQLTWRATRLLTNAMLIVGVAGISIALVAAINIGTVPLGTFDLTQDNIYDEPRMIPVPRTLDRVTLKVSGDREPAGSLELERHTTGNKTAEALTIEGLEADGSIKPGNYYFLKHGEFTVPGSFRTGDTLYLHIKNASSFEGRVKLELTGSKK
jgi:hypothetical protein